MTASAPCFICTVHESTLHLAWTWTYNGFCHRLAYPRPASRTEQDFSLEDILSEYIGRASHGSNDMTGHCCYKKTRGQHRILCQRIDGSCAVPGPAISDPMPSELIFIHVTKTRRDYPGELTWTLSLPPVYSSRFPKLYHDTSFVVHDKHGHLLLRSHFSAAHRERHHPCIQSLAVPEAAFCSCTHLLRSKRR